MKNTNIQVNTNELIAGHRFKSVTKLLAVPFILAIGISGCGITATCPEGTVLEWCGGGERRCCPKDGPSCCIPGDPRYSSLSQLPKPDLSYTNLDGLVDFGTTKLKVEMPADGDYLETQLKGRIAIVGGVCAENQCPMKVLLVQLQPLQKSFTSAKGRTVTDVFLRNANTWTGRRVSDGTIVMDATNKLALEATIDGLKQAVVLNPNKWFTGKIFYNVTRITKSDPRTNNRIAVNGYFTDENKDIRASLTIGIWATNCAPVVRAKAQCLPSIEHGFPGYVHFTSEYSMLGNLQSSQDLCDALTAANPVDVCTAGGTVEFPTFSCKKQPLSLSSDPIEISKLLKFSWQDSNGKVFSDRHYANLHQMPAFPIKLTVENKWGRVITTEITEAPQGRSCPPPQPSSQ